MKFKENKLYGVQQKECLLILELNTRRVGHLAHIFN